jgi:hypothetical protein
MGEICLPPSRSRRGVLDDGHLVAAKDLGHNLALIPIVGITPWASVYHKHSSSFSGGHKHTRIEH